MVRRWLVAAAIAMAAFGLFGSRTLADDAALTARMQAAYDGQCSDIMRGDLNAMQGTLSPNFTATDNGQTVTGDEVVTSLKTLIERVRVVSCRTTIDSVQESGGVVIAIVHQLIDGTAKPPEDAVPVELAGGKRDMWATDAGRLVQTSSMGIWSTLSVGGEIVQQSGTPPSPPPLNASPVPTATETP